VHCAVHRVPKPMSITNLLVHDDVDWVGETCSSPASLWRTGFPRFHVLQSVHLLRSVCRAIIKALYPKSSTSALSRAWYWHFVDCGLVFLFFAAICWGI